MVSDDIVGNAESVDDVKEELDCLFQTNVDDGLRLYPLGEFVHYYEQVSEAAQALLRGPTLSRPQTMNSQVMGMV